MPHEILESPQWKELVARNAAARARAKLFADAGKPCRFSHPLYPPIVVSPSLDSPGEWRITRFDHAGQPTGHSCERSAYDAFFDALNSGYEPFEKPLSKFPEKL